MNDLRCPHCMKQLGCNTQTVCSHCGGRIDWQNPNTTLQVGTLVGERYLVGALLHQNGESVCYLGLDTHSDATVILQEYFPTALAARRTDGWVETDETHLLAYKSLLFDFTDIHKLVRAHAGTGVVPVRDIFLENGTAYAVLQHCTVPTLRTYVEENGTLSFFEAKRLILQLCGAMSPIHAQGVIHGGISSDTVRVDEQPNVHLSGFATLSLRTANTAIPSELFDGFASPEQYDPSKWQGSWSDVYAIGAVLYFMLTGRIPPSAQERERQETYIPLAQCAPSLPENITRTVDRALLLAPEARIQSIEEFSAGILQAAQGNTSVFSIHTGERPVVDDATRVIGLTSVDSTALFAAGATAVVTAEKTSSSRTARKGAGRKRLVLAACLGAAAIVGAAVLLSTTLGDGVGLGTESGSSRVPAPEPNYVPSLEGRHIDAILANSEWNAKFELHVQQAYDDNLPEGIVVRQAPAAGVKMLNRGTIILTVSKGPQKVPMPSIIGSSVDFALRTLAEQEIPFVVIESEEYAEGTVGRTSFAPDQLVDRINDVVEVYIGMRDVEHIGNEYEQNDASDSENAEN